MLILMFFSALAVRLYFLRFYAVISADGISYIDIAKQFIAGNGLASATHYPPFYPILVGLASVVTKDFETAGLAVSILMGSLVVVPVFLLGVEFFDKKTGYLAALLTVTWPSILLWSVNVMSQATYITLLLFGVYFLRRAHKKEAFLPAIFAGLCFGCANLTRSEGILVFFAVTAVLLAFTFINRMPARSLGYVVISWGVFLAVFFPYLNLLHETTGKWQLTGKSRITIADALSEYLKKPDIKHDPSFREMGYLDLFRFYPEYIRTNYLHNLKRCWNEMLPFFGWILAAAGFLAGDWRRERLLERAYLLATFAPLAVIIIFFFIGPEYTQPYLPVLFLWICSGLFLVAAVAERGVDSISGRSPERYFWCVPVLLVLIFGAWNVVKSIPADHSKPYEFSRDGGRFDDKRIGLRLKKLLPENAAIMTRSGRIGFYSGLRYSMPPQASYAEIIAYAKKNKIDYLIATPQLYAIRPPLQFLFAPLLEPERQFTPPPELELVHIGQEPGGASFLIYRFR